MVPFTFRVTGDVAAHELQIWVRLCDQCVWKEEPAGFNPPDKNKPRDRERAIGDFSPGPIFTAMDIHVALPAPNVTSFSMAGYFACSNCPAATKDTGQMFSVTVIDPTSPPAPYIPALGPQ